MVNKINKKKINYEPSDKEEFMNPKQLKYFKNLFRHGKMIFYKNHQIHWTI